MPSTISRHAVARGLAQLRQEQRARSERRTQFQNLELPEDFDEYPDSPSPIYDQFLDVTQTRGIQDLTNFSSVEFDVVWSSIAVDATALWRQHRGPACRYTAKDVFFMMVSVFKNGGKWLNNAVAFDVKAPTFQRMITKFIAMVSPMLYEAWVASVSTARPMELQVTSGNGFKNYPCARYATDVTFQQANTPLRNADTYYSQKHHLHGLKVEVSVLPTGQAINCTDPFPGTESDITIFRRNMAFHSAELLKRVGVQQRIPDDGPLAERFPDSWAVLVDKGYVGLANNMRAIHPKKRPPRGVLSPTDELINRQISSDRIIVENFFGRHCTLWAIMSDKYRWNRDLYGPIFKACAALTNAHVSFHPLRAEDAEDRKLYNQRLYGIARDINDRARAARRRYINMVEIRSEFSRHSYPSDNGLEFRDEDVRDILGSQESTQYGG